MKQIWNTFCEDISKNKGVKEITFEKEIVKGFLQALGWSRYDRNLEEQYGLYSRKQELLIETMRNTNFS